MKKLLVLVSCIVVILVVSKMSFAQEGLVAPDEPAVPSACACAATPMATAPAPYFYPPAPARLPILANRRAARVMPVAAPMVAPEALPYPFGVADLRPRAVRRAAKMMPVPAPMPMPMPVAAPAMPMVAGQPMVAQPASQTTMGPSGQTGKRNISFQRTGTTGPVINFLSIVRTPRDPYAGYMPAYPPMQ